MQKILMSKCRCIIQSNTTITFQEDLEVMVILQKRNKYRIIEI